MKLKISAISDKGCVREHNEDMVLIGDDIFRDDKRDLVLDLKDKQKFFVAVADGMGGHNAGEVASELVLRKIVEKVQAIEEGLTEKDLADRFSIWAKEIHSFILEEGNKDINKKGMGSTLIGVLFYGENVYYINVGDSRLYRLRRGNLAQISKDHSLQEAMGSKEAPSNIILNSFGGGERIFIDFHPAGGVILNGDILLLCSDGLSDMLSDDEIEGILNNEKDNAVDRLLDEAKRKGGEDNISIILIYISLDDFSIEIQASQDGK
ncbi:MAG: protein phosphatase 2C domain-containing protein [candidate division WOR-3 bacterium]